MSSSLSPDEYEVGMGIHNESGIGRTAPIPPLKALISRLLAMLTSTDDPDLSFLPFKGKDNVILLVNNLGGTSELEFNGVVAEVRRQLYAQGIVVYRVFAGTFMVNFLSFLVHWKIKFAIE
jgi:dihydroxyacetone kinase